MFDNLKWFIFMISVNINVISVLYIIFLYIFYFSKEYFFFKLSLDHLFSHYLLLVFNKLFINILIKNIWELDSIPIFDKKKGNNIILKSKNMIFKILGLLFISFYYSLIF